MEPVNVAALPSGVLLLMDSGPVIYLLDRHPKFSPVFKPLFAAHDAGRFRLTVTTITLAEVLTGPLQAGDEALAERYRATLESWQVVELGADIAATAARLQAPASQAG